MKCNHITTKDFYKLVADLLPISVFVELGTYKGDSAAQWVANLPGATIYLVDTWRPMPGTRNKRITSRNTVESMEEIYQGLKEKYQDTNVHLLRTSTIAATGLFYNESVDAVYLDADHTYLGVLADIDWWKKKMKPGAIMAGHDYTKGSVRDALATRFDSITVCNRMFWYTYV